MMTTKWTDAEKEHLEKLVKNNPSMSVREIAMEFVKTMDTRTVEAVKNKLREYYKLHAAQEEAPQTEPAAEPTVEAPAVEHVADEVPAVEEVPENAENAPVALVQELPVNGEQTPAEEEKAPELPKQSLFKKIINWLFS